MTTTWRGVTLDQRTADMISEVDGLLPDVPMYPSQGSYSGSTSASAGTHDGGGAIDMKAVDLSSDQRNRLVKTMRMVGFAAWLRTPSQSNWPYHIHGIAVQPGGKGDRGVLAAPAHDQVVDYYEGRNGLASNAPDDGPRNYVGVTWESYNGQAAPPSTTPPPSSGYPAPTSNKVYVDRLFLGSNDSDSVWYMQRAFNVHSLSGAGSITLVVDGDYGPQTEQVVIADQQQHGGSWGEGAADSPGSSFVGNSQAAHLFAGSGLTIVNK